MYIRSYVVSLHSFGLLTNKYPWRIRKYVNITYERNPRSARSSKKKKYLLFPKVVSFKLTTLYLEIFNGFDALFKPITIELLKTSITRSPQNFHHRVIFSSLERENIPRELNLANEVREESISTLTH